MERWVPLEAYPGYSISDRGEIKNDTRDRLLSIVRTKRDYAAVSLVKDGTQVTRSVSKLVCDAFLPIPKNATFTTPIHFDGNHWNCHVDNLDWRPRWFALKHSSQFRKDIVTSPHPIVDLKTGDTFENIWEATLMHGLLYMDVILSIHEKTYVFPTMQMFDWLR